MFIAGPSITRYILVKVKVKGQGHYNAEIVFPHDLRTRMVPLALSTDHNVPIPEAGMTAVSHTAGFSCVLVI